MFKLKRVYEEPGPDDGLRVLVDRLWPRGMTRERAAIDLWLKDVAPSSELRKWYHVSLDRWDAFCLRYEKELDEAAEAVEELRERGKHGTVTLVYASANPDVNHARALKSYLEHGEIRP